MGTCGKGSRLHLDLIYEKNESAALPEPAGWCDWEMCSQSEIRWIFSGLVGFISVVWRCFSMCFRWRSEGLPSPW